MRQLLMFILRNISNNHFVEIFDIVVKHKTNFNLTPEENNLRLTYTKFLTKSLVKMGFDSPKTFQPVWFNLWLLFSIHGYHISNIKKLSTFDVLNQFINYYTSFDKFELVYEPVKEIGMDYLLDQNLAKKLYLDLLIANSFNVSKIHNKKINDEYMLPYLSLMIINSCHQSSKKNIHQCIIYALEYIEKHYCPSLTIMEIIYYVIVLAFDTSFF